MHWASLAVGELSRRACSTDSGSTPPPGRDSGTAACTYFGAAKDCASTTSGSSACTGAGTPPTPATPQDLRASVRALESLGNVGGKTKALPR